MTTLRRTISALMASLPFAGGVVLLVVLLLSCVNEYPATPEADNEIYRIRFTFSMVGGGTRTITDETLAGVSRENYIDFSKVRFFLFDQATGGDSKVLAELIPSSTLQSGSDPGTWEVVAIISDDTGHPLTLSQLALGYKIVCIANMDGVPAPAAGTKLSEMLRSSSLNYSFSATDAGTYHPFAGPTDPKMLIPMYGVLTVPAGMVYRPMNPTPVGQIEMLRAISKIVVKFNDGLSSDEDMEIVSASINKYNSMGRVAPDNVYDSTDRDWQNIASTLSRRGVWLPAGAQVVTEPLGFSTFTNSEGKKRSAVIYLPEYANAESKDLEITVSVKTSPTAEPYERTFPVSLYEDGNPKPGTDLNLARNYCITYTLTGSGEYLYVVQVGMESWIPVPGEYEIHTW